MRLMDECIFYVVFDISNYIYSKKIYGRCFRDYLVDICILKDN